MRILFASDLHGSEFYCEKLLEAYREQRAQKLILLGDLLYHGPRNSLPRCYEPKTVIELLNSVSDDLLCVRGNCDTEVDQMVLSFPIMADYSVLFLHEECAGQKSCSAAGGSHNNPGGKAGRDITIYLTHGHVFNGDRPPKLKNGDLLICGHTHIPGWKEYDGYIYLNPGSVSIPKGGSPNSYMVYESGCFTWFDFEGNAFLEYHIWH